MPFLFPSSSSSVSSSSSFSSLLFFLETISSEARLHLLCNYGTEFRVGRCLLRSTNGCVKLRSHPFEVKFAALPPSQESGRVGGCGPGRSRRPVRPLTGRSRQEYFPVLSSFSKQPPPLGPFKAATVLWGASGRAGSRASVWGAGQDSTQGQGRGEEGGSRPDLGHRWLGMRIYEKDVRPSVRMGPSDGFTKQNVNQTRSTSAREWKAGGSQEPQPSRGADVKLQVLGVGLACPRCL